MLTDSNHLLGKSLGTCVLQRLLGRGGMGAVYLAQQSRPRRIVAIKVLLPDLFLQPDSYAEFLARFRREADAIATLDHVNIMPLYEYGEQEQLAYLVMPYVTGGTLRDILEQRGRLSLQEAVSVTEQIASALDYAHGHGIIHRDLKPGNIVFHADGRLLLADFGIAKVLSDPTLAHQVQPLTTTGMMIGTPEYFSPEQATGNPIDRRSDVYSLGVVLFQMLSGQVPFTGNTPVVVAIKHAMEEPPSLTQINAAIPREVEAVVRKALAKKPEQRYASAGELARALRNAISGATTLDRSSQVFDAPTRSSQENLTPIVLSNAANITPVPPPKPQGSFDVDAFTVPMTSSRSEFTGSAELTTTPTIASSPSRPFPSQAQIEAADAPTIMSTRPTTLPPAPVPQQPRPRRRFPLWATILSVLLVLGLIVVGLAFALRWLPLGGSTAGTGQQTATPGRTATATPQPTATPTPAPLPSPLVTAGTRLFGSALPLCDQYSNLWTQPSASAQDVQKTCEASDLRLKNTGQQLHGVYLQKLPGGAPLPNDYLVEVQVKEISQSDTPFGIFFHVAQASGYQSGGYGFLIQPSGIWKGDEYTGGQTKVLVSGSGRTLNASGFTTVDITVQGNLYTLYYDGVSQGTVLSSNYSQGFVGLAVDVGADVLFKDFAIYSLP